MAWFRWLLVSIAAFQFVAVGLPPGNADLLSIQLLAYDLSHDDVRLLYPGRDYALNESWVEHHERNLRELRVDGEPNWCFYPPLVPYLCVPIAHAGIETWRVAWGAIQILLAVLYALLIERMLTALALPASRVLIFALVFGSYPVARSVFLGQTSLLIAVLLWIAIYLRELRGRSWSALITGAACFVKPFLLIGELPRIFRRQYRTTAIALTMMAVLLAISLAILGVTAHREYWNLLSTLGASQTAFSGNQSLLAGLMRIGTPVSVSDYGFQMDPTLNGVGKLVALVVLAIAAGAQLRSKHVRIVYSVGLWYSAILLALPISWEHHLIILLPVIAFLWAEQPRPFVPLLVTTLALSVALESSYGDTAGGKLASIVPLFGNCCLFVLLTRLHLKSRRTPALPATS
ncbi:DUF2029 domain-containing protein [candidate division KSB1 bacterium]|nr:DUF2029 domain-containing protein [candidate division KSB1 bacterium]